MPNMVLLALKQNLANAEKMNDPDRVKRIKARISKLEKAEKAEAEAVDEEPAKKEPAKKSEES